MTPPTNYRYAGGYNRCVGGVMTPPYMGAEHPHNSATNQNLYGLRKGSKPDEGFSEIKG